MSSVNKGTFNKRTSDRIKAGKLVGRLLKFSLAEPEDPDFANKQMTQGQVSAARILLSKVMPDLKQIEFDGKLEQTVTQITRKVVKPKPTSS